MKLEEIYQPIRREMSAIERMIRVKMDSSGNAAILEISNYLLSSPGKRLRPAMVTLSARAVLRGRPAGVSRQVIKIASAVELIHLASLIHDDVVDHSQMRHNKPTINSRWGEDVSLILGDYLYSLGFDLISSCRNGAVLACISQATRAMCEGELIQVCGRDNISLLKERYITIVKNKTGNLFAASCEAGALAAGRPGEALGMLKEYGLNFGIAFQIVDDLLDLVGSRRELGKTPGADFKMGEVTLPILNLLSESKDKKRIFSLLRQRNDEGAFKKIKREFINSGALLKTREEVAFYAGMAKKNLHRLQESVFKQSLSRLADYITGKT